MTGSALLWKLMCIDQMKRLNTKIWDDVDVNTLCQNKEPKKTPNPQCCVLIASPDALAVCKTTVTQASRTEKTDLDSDVERMQMKEEEQSEEMRWAGGEMSFR